MPVFSSDPSALWYYMSLSLSVYRSGFPFQESSRAVVVVVLLFSGPPFFPLISRLRSFSSASSLAVLRLLMFGLVAGCTSDALILTTVLASQDPFTMPSSLLIKHPAELSEKLQLSLKSRAAYDANQYSEPIMLRYFHVLSCFSSRLVSPAEEKT